MAHGTTGLTGDQPGSSDLVLAESAARFATNQVALARVAPPPGPASQLGHWSVGLVGGAGRFAPKYLQGRASPQPRGILPRAPE